MSLYKQGRQGLASAEAPRGAWGRTPGGLGYMSLYKQGPPGGMGARPQGGLGYMSLYKQGPPGGSHRPRPRGSSGGQGALGGYLSFYQQC